MMISTSKDQLIGFKTVKVHDKKLSKGLDWMLIGYLMIISMLSLLLMLSSDQGSWVFFQRQIIRLCIGWTAFILISLTPPRYFKIAAWPSYIISIILLLMILVIGHTGKGAQRWINLGFIKCEPSELLKVTLPLLLSYTLVQFPSPLTFKNFSIASMIIGLPVLLILKQPDLGTGLIITFSSLGVLGLYGIRKQVIISLICLGTLFLPISWYGLHDYQQQRILTLIQPNKDVQGKGYHIHQSKIAIGSGGLYGKGFMKGSQAHLGFLPEHHTDFIFALLAEEFGFFGCTMYLGIVCLLFRRLKNMVLSIKDYQHLLHGTAIMVLLFISHFINIAMVCGFLPVVGVPLPLMSYGGTSSLITLVNLGILMAYYRHRNV
ncbi:MAG TPA: rod shape-determining protein RodA [Gammaproteobacteria bacterium]|nr:rod shape-determining protein RodA [Gammaproteobacteria bacterium]